MEKDNRLHPPSISRRNLLLHGTAIAGIGALIGLIGCDNTNAELGGTASDNNDSASVINGIKADGGYQLDKVFPVLSDNDAFDDSLITNAMDTFIGFEKQGSLLVNTTDPSKFKIFVNGTAVPLNDVGKSDWASIDISSVTVNGNNRLQVSGTDAGEDTMAVRIPYPELIDATDEYQNNDNFKLLDEIIQAEIDNGFTSAQLVVARNGQIIKQSAYGQCNSYSKDGKRLKDGAKVTNDTLYDLASNTKMYCTNYAVQKLASDGKLDVTKLVSTYIPEFKDKPNDAIKGKDMLTVQEILQHQAGFPADPQYHNIDYNPTTQKTEIGSRANQALYTQKRDEALQKIIETPLEYMPGTKTKYSDVDYMLLGFIVEKITGQRLDEYVSDSFYEPLNLKHVTFNPLDNGFTKDDCAATELNGNTRDGVISFENIRTDTIQGEVHDEKAFYTMEGISGHAGLFSNAKDLAILTQIIINRGGYGDHRFFDEDTLDQFIKPKDTNASYGLGWRRKATSLYSWAFSPISDTSTVGHTGWTGTLTVIDPVENVSVVLLTNTKNSPVLDKEANPNDFVGNHYLTGSYGMPATISFDGEGGNADCNNAKLVDLIRAKYQLIETNVAYQTNPDVAELKALVQVVDQRKDSELISTFKKTGVWKSAVDLAGR